MGYRLVFLSNDASGENLAAELGCIGLRGSVMSVEDIARAVKTAVDAFGRIDLVVNGTGHAAVGELLEVTDEDWHSGLELTLLSVIRMGRTVMPVMERQSGGVIVNMSSYTAVAPFPIGSVGEALRNALAAWTKMYAGVYRQSTQNNPSNL